MVWRVFGVWSPLMLMNDVTWVMVSILSHHTVNACGIGRLLVSELN